MPQVFVGNDRKYFSWLIDHSQGFVVNTRRQPDGDYMVLHRATCSSINHYSSAAKPGGFTERNYIKICSDDVRALREWVWTHGRADGSFSTECSLCKPI